MSARALKTNILIQKTGNSVFSKRSSKTCEGNYRTVSSVKQRLD